MSRTLAVTTPYKAIITSQIDTTDIKTLLAFHTDCYDTMGGVVVTYPNKKSAEIDMAYLIKNSTIQEQDIEIVPFSYSEMFA